MLRKRGAPHLCLCLSYLLVCLPNFFFVVIILNTVMAITMACAMCVCVKRETKHQEKWRVID